MEVPVSKTIFRKVNLIFGILAFASLLVSFQNCSTPIDFAGFESKANGNGTGYDGKPFGNHGICSNTGTPAVALKNEILVKSDGTMNMTKSDCIDLDPPIPVDVSAVKRPLNSGAFFVYQNEIYDYLDPDLNLRRLTRLVCWNHSGMPLVDQIRISYKGNAAAMAVAGAVPNLGAEYFSLANTGSDFAVNNEAYVSPNQLRWDAVGTYGNLSLSSYNIATAPSYGSATIKVNGTVQPIGGLQCYIQLPPPYN